MRMIDADAFYEVQKTRCGGTPLIGTCTKDNSFLATEIMNAPTVDAVEVVRCKDCAIHGKCMMEDTFILARMENPFCCAGERRESDERGKT